MSKSDGTEVEPLDRLLRRIIDMLESHGRVEPAAWLEHRRRVIVDPEALPPEKDTAAREIHLAIPGMGGLGDVQLKTREATLDLERLAETLFEMTMPSEQRPR